MTASLSRTLARALGYAVRASPTQHVMGGSVNRASRYESARGPLFVKYGPPTAAPMFEAEAEGLAELASAKCLRTPQVFAVGADPAFAYLALEWIDLETATGHSEALLGERLAELHRVTQSHFGWRRDNTIGSTAQCNLQSASWSAFWREQRLGQQLRLAADKGAPARLIDRGGELCNAVKHFFRDYQPLASLLHGDLWGGNWGADERQQPVIFDPAVYYGDREADIAMTHLFGGFGAPFYQAYQAAWPLDPGAGARRTLYNLYHVLNHYNLFGGGYAGQAQSMVDALLAELGH